MVAPDPAQYIRLPRVLDGNKNPTRITFPLLSNCTLLLVFNHNLFLRRHYAGWLKKNKFVEEWNGRREITEKSFEAKPSNFHMFVLWGFGAPAGVYFGPGPN